MQSYWNLTGKLVLCFGRCSASCLFGSCALGPHRTLQFLLLKMLQYWLAYLVFCVLPSMTWESAVWMPWATAAYPYPFSLIFLNSLSNSQVDQWKIDFVEKNEKLKGEEMFLECCLWELFHFRNVFPSEHSHLSASLNEMLPNIWMMSKWKILDVRQIFSRICHTCQIWHYSNH